MSGPYITLGSNIVTTDNVLIGKNTLAFTSTDGIYLKYPNIYANTNTNSSMNLYASNGFNFWAGATRLLNIDVNGIISCNGFSCGNGIISSNSSIATSGSVTCSSLNCYGAINGVTSLNAITLSGSTISGVNTLSCNSLITSPGYLTINGSIIIDATQYFKSTGPLTYLGSTLSAYLFLRTWNDSSSYFDFSDTLYFRLTNTDGSVIGNMMWQNVSGFAMNGSDNSIGGGCSITTSKILIGDVTGPFYNNCGIKTGSSDGFAATTCNMYISSHDGIAFCYGSGNTVPLISLSARNGYLVTSDSIYATGSFFSSDIRIKTNIVDIDDVSAMATLMLIEPKRYNYIDVDTKGNEPVWGFIAQQVRRVLPYSTSLMKKDIPNIYDFANVASDMITITLSTKSTSLFERDTSGNLCQITIQNSIKQLFALSISSIIDDKTFVITKALTDEELNNVADIFVFGSVVDDFHALDKNAIFTIATAALQELDRKYQAAKLVVATLTSQVATLIAQVNLLMQASLRFPPQT